MTWCPSCHGLRWTYDGTAPQPCSQCNRSGRAPLPAVERKETPAK